MLRHAVAAKSKSPSRSPAARAPRPTLDQQLAAVRALDLAAPDAIDQLRSALRSPIGVVVAAAAKRVGDDQVDAVADELAPAFERLLEDAVKRDPGCRGKLAIVHALHALDRWDDRVFVPGVRHVQREGWGNEDIAASLRGKCGIAYAQHRRDDALAVLATLLADPERAAREGAARGFGDSGRRDATAVLRYKLLVSDRDEDPDVLAACVESLLALAKDESYDFLAGLLAGHDPRAEVVALALGGARIAAAFEPIAAWCLGATPDQRDRVGYLAIALLRTEAGTAYLLDAIRSNARAGAVAAAKALATFRDDAAVVDQVRAAAREHGDAAVAREIEQLLAQ